MSTPERVNPQAARLCEGCSNLITTAPSCPLCDRPTIPHPAAGDDEGICNGCEAIFPTAALHLVTWQEDAEPQTEADLIMLCPKCHEREADE